MITRYVVILCFIFTWSFGQANKKNYIKIHPIGFVNKVKINYERVLDTNFTIGLSAAYHYFIFKGPTASLNVRFYYDNTAPKGPYLQAQVGYYNMETELIIEVKDKFSEAITVKKSAKGFGFGFGLGHQYLFGKQKNISLDVMGGLKFYKVATNQFYYDENGVKSINDLTPYWYLIGPGSFFNGQLSLGYGF